MTGRELIIYILENQLEDVIMFENGSIAGFMTVQEAAVTYEVGTATIHAWVKSGKLKSINIGNEIYIIKSGKEMSL